MTNIRYENCLSDAKSFLSISPQSVPSCSNQHVVKLLKVVDKVFRSCKQSKKLSQFIDNRVVDNIVNKVINHVITSFNKVVKSQAVGFQSTSCRQTIIKLSARLPKQRIAMLFRLSFQCSFYLSNIMLQRMASCTQTDELGERKEQQGQKMLECLVFIGTFSPRLQGSRLELKTQKPLMDNL